MEHVPTQPTAAAMDAALHEAAVAAHAAATAAAEAVNAKRKRDEHEHVHDGSPHEFVHVSDTMSVDSKRDDALSQLGVLQSVTPLGMDDTQPKRDDTSTQPEHPPKRQYSFIPDGIKERAIVLVLQHKCSVSDVAEVMGVSRGALYKHIERARKQLDDAARSRAKGDRRHAPSAVTAAAAAKMEGAAPSSQMKALVAKLKASMQKGGPGGAATPLRSGSPDAVAAATAAAAAAVAAANAMNSATSSVVL